MFWLIALNFLEEERARPEAERTLSDHFVMVARMYGSSLSHRFVSAITCERGGRTDADSRVCKSPREAFMYGIPPATRFRFLVAPSVVGTSIDSCRSKSYTCDASGCGDDDEGEKCTPLAARIIPRSTLRPPLVLLQAPPVLPSSIPLRSMAVAVGQLENRQTGEANYYR